MHLPLAASMFRDGTTHADPQQTFHYQYIGFQKERSWSDFIKDFSCCAVDPSAQCMRGKMEYSKRLHKPSPLSGTDPVNPVLLVAPATAGMSTSQTVIMDVAINRSSGFNDPIGVSGCTDLFLPNGIQQCDQPPYLTIPGNANRRSGAFLKVVCTRVANQGAADSVQLDVNAIGQQSMTFTGATQATRSLRITVYTFVQGGSGTGSDVSWNAPHQLAISCLRDSPIN